MKKVIVGIVIVLLAGIAVLYISVHEKLPEGRDHETADILAGQMLEAINDSAWQATGAISWNFTNSHEHLWDRERHLARVSWKKYEVYVDLSNIDGIAFKDGERLEGKQKDKIVLKAWKFWVNDSFWLNPVSKAFDEGTTRSLVTLKDGREGLMVSYSSGGDTPGDSYVWILDENHRPVAWKMWVSILPLGGIEVPWDNWITTETGVQICNLHDAAINIELADVRSAFTLEELTGGNDPFAVLF